MKNGISVRDEAERHKRGELPKDSTEGTNIVNPEFWRGGLVCNKEGAPKACMANVMHVLSLHPEWAGVLAYDLFAETVVTRSVPPMRPQDQPDRYELGDWTETDSTRTVAWFDAEVGIGVRAEIVTQAVVAIAERHKVHPVRDYLAGLHWDGTARLDLMLTRYFGAPDDPYTRAVSAKFMIGAVARVREPGCKCDTMLILEGKQGTKKSTGVKILAVDWYADTGVTVGEKDSYQALRHVWIYEFAELAAVRGRDAERVKNFLSSGTDHYRPSYGRRFRDFPRQTVFVATTNEANYLVDRTGNRRFWPVRCNRVNATALAADRNQLWAEAVHRHTAGETWHVDTAELAALCEAEQADRQAPDDWIPVVEKWLEAPSTPGSHGGRDLIEIARGLTTVQVLTGAIGMKVSDITHAASTRAGYVLRELGFEPRQHREGTERVRRYARVTPVTASDVGGCAGVVTPGAASPSLDSSLSHPSHPYVHTHVEGGEGAQGALALTPKPAVPAVTCDSDSDGYESDERAAIEDEGGGT